MSQINTLEPEALGRSEAAPLRRSRITKTSDGTDPIVRKTGRGGDRASIRREAEVLRAVGGSDLVHLIDLSDGPETTELLLRDTGGPSLAAALADPTTSSNRALLLMANACDAVARLHERGWAHGRVEPDHVLLTGRGRVRLCSLSAATPLEVDPSVGRADRIALLRMVDDWTRAPVGAGRAAPLATRLRARLLERRTHRLPDDPDPRLLARILRRTARFGDVGIDVRHGAPRAMAVTLGVATIVSIGWWVLPTSSSPGRSAGADTTASRQAAPASTSSVTTTPPAPSTTAMSTAAPSERPAATDPNCAAATSLDPDVDGDGCGDAVEIDGNAVVVGDRRYRLGSDGDVVAVGDWDCDGVATAAVLRPSTGSVHMFDRWAAADGPARAVDLGRIVGAVSFAAPTGPCGPPRVSTVSGAVQAAGDGQQP